MVPKFLKRRVYIQGAGMRRRRGMNFSFVDLWRWDGTVGRRAYLLAGALLFALKWNVDRFITNSLTGRSWPFVDLEGFLDYLLRRTDYSANPTLAFTMLAGSLPFMWVGLVLTIRRLRSADLPRWLAALYFVPFVKLVLFAMLCIIPPAQVREEEKSVHVTPFERFIGAWLPHSPFGSALVAALNVAATGGVLAYAGTTWLRSYQWAVFVGVPFGMGFLAVALHCYRAPRSFWSCMGVASLSVVLLGAGFLVFAVEGIICLAMAAPLALVLSGLGGALAYGLQRTLWHGGPGGRLMCVALSWMPLLAVVEHVAPPDLPMLRVTTSLEIDAPPQLVWNHVVAFAELPPPTEFIFRHGIAYPVRARINGVGAGAVRRCEFSTGAFVEPIEKWDEPRLLGFSVLENPAPMEEWTPYRQVKPPHLDGFFCSRRGQFHLIARADGGTTLEGTTWYHNHMWPAAYWQVWSDAILHRIHIRVLRHVKTLAERDVTKL
jgi:uncharacterized membrane protein YhaH (DUF805 family)